MLFRFVILLLATVAMSIPAHGQTRPRRAKPPAKPKVEKPRKLTDAEIKAWEERAKAEKNAFPADRPIQVGDKGTFAGGWRLEVVSVIDGENALVQTTRTVSYLVGGFGGQPQSKPISTSEIAWLRIPTAGMVDGRVIWAEDIDGLLFKATGTTTYETALATKTVLVFEKIDDAKERGAPAKLPAVGGDKEKAVGPTRWINVSYDTLIYHVKGKQWAELDNKTKKDKWNLDELERTDDYVVLYNADRKETWRLGAKKMEIKKGDKWEWISTGKWEAAK